MEEVFKGVSRKFQELVQRDGEGGLGSRDEAEDMMAVLKKEKENLVIIRSLIPTRIQGCQFDKISIFGLKITLPYWPQCDSNNSKMFQNKE